METAIQKQSFYHIRLDHLELLQAIEDNEGEITPEIENDLSLTQEQFQDKAISYGYVIKKFEDNEEIIEKEIARLSALKDRAVKRKELFKQRLSDGMQQFGVEKITTPLISLSFIKSESVNITDEDDVPAQYIAIETVEKIDKRAIKEVLKAGFDVPGAEIVTKNHLQIK